MARYFHVTTTACVESIAASGLLVCCAAPTARIKGVWLVTASKVAWAIVHVASKRRVALEQVVVVEIEVNRKTLKKFRQGIWVSRVDVDASRIKAYRPAADYGQGA